MLMDRQNRQQGQALVEFALTLPILLLITMGIFDFSRVMFTFAQANSSLRDAVRYAEVLGYTATKPYTQCDTLIDAAARDYWFASNPDVTVSYQQTSLGLVDSDGNATGKEMTCTEYKNGTPDANDFEPKDGDVVIVRISTPIKLVALSGYKINLDFEGQRTIVSTIALGTGPNDSDYDGLDDLWEYGYFGDLKSLATDDPDSDGCNNGCEEYRKSDPTVSDAYPAATGGTGTPLTTAYMPTYSVLDFKAIPNCSGSVNFTWTLPTGADALTSDSLIEIYEPGGSPPLVVTAPYYATSVSGAGPSGSGSRTYYAVVRTTYRQEKVGPTIDYETNPVYVHGGASNLANAPCDPPQPPSSFKAEVNCTVSPRLVTFTWSAPNPLPSYVRIYDGDGTLLQDNLTQLNSFGNKCTDCATLPASGYEVYYMTSVAVRQSGSVESGPSPYAVASCLSGPAALPTGGGINLTGNFYWDKGDTPGHGKGTFSDGNGQWADDELQGIQFLLTYAGTDNNFGTADDQTVVLSTDEFGYYSVTNLAAGKYKVRINLPINIQRLINLDWAILQTGSPLAYQAATQTPTLEFTATTTLNVGLYDAP